MSATIESTLQQFNWEVQPAAARWLTRAVEVLADRNPAIDRLGGLLRAETGTRLRDWIDHISIGDDEFARLRGELGEVGYVAETNGPQTVWRQPHGMFPPVLVEAGRVGIGVRCDAVETCVTGLPQLLKLPAVDTREVLGAEGGPFRRACLSTQDGVGLWIIERHGHASFESRDVPPQQIEAAARRLAAFRARERRFHSYVEGFRHASAEFADAAADLGTAWACDLFFQAEREYWQRRNTAGRVQYERQNRLGLGWANHDHHTYRSSRAAFTQLIATLEQMGFQCRERFYAGREAGWGAQVLEQPQCRLVIFADVDLSAEELAGDFAHEPLPQREALGTVGLWCELHGEAFLEAGMHHLECQFDFDSERDQLAAAGVETMAPFTNFPFLRQAFTRGEMWRVDPERIERLRAEGRITAEQAERFGREGALGSHLEILERNEGYKGFNQTGVSDIISRTDPRRVIGA
jgi:hypothetical protein